MIPEGCFLPRWKGALLLGAPLAFSACVVQPVGLRQEGPVTDVKFCGMVTGIAWFQQIGPDQGRQLVHDLEAGAPGLQVGAAASQDEAETNGCDVYLALNFTGLVGDSFNLDAEAFSARSGRSLLKTHGHSGALGGLGGSTQQSLAQVGGILAQQFAPETPAYKRLAEEREAKKAQGSGGLSKSELKELVQAAVEGAQAQRKGGPQTSGAQTPASDVDKPRYHQRQNADDFAVVVGIEDYGTLPKADFAERDAQAVRDYLAALGVPQRNIEFLTGARASRAGLVKILETKLPNLVNENSTVYFYFSGHGSPDPKTGQAYLVPADGDPEYLEDTAYPLKRLYGKLGALKAKLVLVALDSCFSGAGGRSILPKGSRPLVTKVDLAPSSGKLVVITASSGQQISGTLEETGHGAFTYYLLKGLNGAAQDEQGGVTVRSLFDYLSPTRIQPSAPTGSRSRSS